MGSEGVGHTGFPGDPEAHIPQVSFTKVPPVASEGQTHVGNSGSYLFSVGLALGSCRSMLVSK